MINMGNKRQRYTDEEWEELENNIDRNMGRSINAYYLTVNGKAARLGGGNVVPSDCVYFDYISCRVYNSKMEFVGYGRVLREIFSK